MLVDVVVLVVESVTEILMGTLALSVPFSLTSRSKSYVFPAVRELVFTRTCIVLSSSDARQFMVVGFVVA